MNNENNQTEINEKQRNKITEIFNRHETQPTDDNGNLLNLDNFIKSAFPILGTKNEEGHYAVGVFAWGMMIGIETDGSSHTQEINFINKAHKKELSITGIPEDWKASKRCKRPKYLT